MTISSRYLIEICVTHVESAVAAEAGGADRIELCENLDVGGVTPSAGTIGLACERLGIPVNVLVRPRGGDFCYSPTEIEVMRRDILACRDLGAAGIVTGCLTPDGRVDLKTLEHLVAAAGPLPLTFHKAFDEVRDPIDSLRSLERLGVARVLTSGARGVSGVAAPGATEGLAALAAAANRIRILAGGRVRIADLPRLREAGIAEIHAASAVVAPGTGRVDPALVEEMVRTWRPGPRGGLHL